MISVKLSNRSIGIGFKHTQRRVKIIPSDPRWRPTTIGMGEAMGIDRFTTCQLFDLGSETSGKVSTFLVTEAVATCHPFDQFRKSAGRKVALTRALAKLKLSKADRTTVWNAYLNRGEGK